MKTKIENGIEYTLKNDIWYPTLEMKERGIRLGKYGMMRKGFLEKHRQVLYDRMALAGELYTHCKDVGDRAKYWKNAITKRYVVKGQDVRSANDIAEEIVKRELIVE